MDVDVDVVVSITVDDVVEVDVVDALTVEVVVSLVAVVLFPPRGFSIHPMQKNSRQNTPKTRSLVFMFRE